VSNAETLIHERGQKQKKKHSTLGGVAVWGTTLTKQLPLPEKKRRKTKKGDLSTHKVSSERRLVFGVLGWGGLG